MKKVIYLSVILLILSQNLFSQDKFLNYKNEIINYLYQLDTPYQDILTEAKNDDNTQWVWQTHSYLENLCNYEFYEFYAGGVCLHCKVHIAMIDNEKNTIAFLDTLLLEQTLDSINHTIKNCKQSIPPQKRSDLYDNIKATYKHNQSVGINLRSVYLPLSQMFTNPLLTTKKLTLDYEAKNRVYSFVC